MSEARQRSQQLKTALMKCIRDDYQATVAEEVTRIRRAHVVVYSLVAIIVMGANQYLYCYWCSFNEYIHHNIFSLTLLFVSINEVSVSLWVLSTYKQSNETSLKVARGQRQLAASFSASKSAFEEEMHRSAKRSAARIALAITVVVLCLVELGRRYLHAESLFKEEVDSFILILVIYLLGYSFGDFFLSKSRPRIYMTKLDGAVGRYKISVLGEMERSGLNPNNHG